MRLLDRWSPWMLCFAILSWGPCRNGKSSKCGHAPWGILAASWGWPCRNLPVFTGSASHCGWRWPCLPVRSAPSIVRHAACSARNGRGQLACKACPRGCERHRSSREAPPGTDRAARANWKAVALGGRLAMPATALRKRPPMPRAVRSYLASIAATGRALHPGLLFSARHRLRACARTGPETPPCPPFARQQSLY